MLRSRIQNNAGRRTTEVVIEEATDGTANAAGEVLPEWSTYCERFAKKAHESGREFQAAMTTQAILVAVYELPYDEKTKAITPRMRMKIGTRVFGITSVSDLDDAHEKIILGLIEPVSV
jgi:head-tail adaptor